MAAPYRGNTGLGSYFVTANTFQKHSLLRSERMAGLFLDVLLSYRVQQKYLLHEFVIMPDHFHCLITVDAQMTVEKAVQFNKRGLCLSGGT